MSEVSLCFAVCFTLTVWNTSVVPYLRLARPFIPGPRLIPILSKQGTGRPWAINTLAIRLSHATHTSYFQPNDSAMVPIPPNLYSQVIEWVAQQQQLARAGQPATMTAAQRKALIELHQLVKPADVEPDFQGGAEWISFLNRRFSFLISSSAVNGKGGWAEKETPLARLQANQPVRGGD